MKINETLLRDFRKMNIEYEDAELKSITYSNGDLLASEFIKFDIEHKAVSLNCYLYSLEELESIIETCKELQLFKNN